MGEIWRRQWLCYLGRIKGSGENLEAQFEFGARRGKWWFPFRGLSRQLEFGKSRARRSPRFTESRGSRSRVGCTRFTECTPGQPARLVGATGPTNPPELERVSCGRAWRMERRVREGLCTRCTECNWSITRVATGLAPELQFVYD